MSEPRSLYWEDVTEGVALPVIEYELSLLRLVAMVRATGLYDYVHFDRDYARAAGARDVFASTPHTLGLFARLLTEWSGPGADIRSITLRMRSSCCAGDLLRISGKVGRKWLEERDGAVECLVEIVDLVIAHQHAAEASLATAVLALPSRAHGPVRTGLVPSPAAPAQLGPDVPEFARTLVGSVIEGPPEPRRPLTADEILLWCEALEDWNPLYWDEAYARGQRHGGVIAPAPAMFHGANSATVLGLGVRKPGGVVPEPVRQGLTGMPLLQALRKEFVAHAAPFAIAGFPEIAVAEARSDYYRPMRPGDTGRTTQQVLDCSALKKTRLGEGYFLKWVRAVSNQHGQLVRTFTVTGFVYRTVVVAPATAG